MFKAAYAGEDAGCDTRTVIYNLVVFTKNRLYLGKGIRALSPLCAFPHCVCLIWE
jgi:hypothetical protein